MPEVSHRPVIRNPFPQLSKVAVAPFFNQSDEPTVDGRQVALAYFSELQATPGFEVVPLGVVEEAIIRHQVDLNGPGEARRLAKLLGVDAVIVGAVTDFSPYYPPRCGLHVEWYAADPSFFEIPAGYGLPWNTPDEEFIPDSLVYQAQLAQARSEMKPPTPAVEPVMQTLPAPPQTLHSAKTPVSRAAFQSPDNDSVNAGLDPFDEPANQPPPADDLPADAEALPAPNAAQRRDEPGDSDPTMPSITPTPTDDSPPATDATPPTLVNPSLPGVEPEASPPAVRPVHHGPVLSHTQIYRGNDPDLTQALKGYVYFQDDERFGGWQGYLQRSDDFVRFCCHMHISEMLSARGGSRKTSVVWRWPNNR